MPKKKQALLKTTLRQKAALVGLGLFLFLTFTELGLRLGGLVYSYLQERRNIISARQKGAFRIMCLGESTTAGGEGSYPAQLEQVLNRRNPGLKFSVINKGVPAIETNHILAHLEENLRECRPDMVTAMIGVNEYYVKYYEDIADTQTFWFKNFKVYRLFKILWMNCVKKNYAGALPSAGQEGSVSTPQLVKAGEEGTCVGGLSPFRTEEEGRIALAKDPQDAAAYFRLALFFMQQIKLPEAIEAYKKSIELNPKNEAAYFNLGLCFNNLKNYGLAEGSFNKAAEINPLNAKAFMNMGLCLMYQAKYIQAEKAFLRAIEVEPDNDIVYGALSIIYQDLGNSRLANEYSNKAKKLRLGLYSPAAKINYQKIKIILDKRGIKLVCIQYPMRSIEPLKNIFRGQEGVVFVDNEGVFREALKKTDFKVYFRDMFAGDFGHCTFEGNRLLAENIAKVILKEYFKR